MHSEARVRQGFEARFLPHLRGLISRRVFCAFVDMTPLDPPAKRRRQVFENAHFPGRVLSCHGSTVPTVLVSTDLEKPSANEPAFRLHSCPHVRSRQDTLTHASSAPA